MLSRPTFRLQSRLQDVPRVHKKAACAALPLFLSSAYFKANTLLKTRLLPNQIIISNLAKMPSIARSTKASTGPMRTLTTTRQLRKGQSGVCRPALKSSAAAPIVITCSAAPLISRHARPAPLSSAFKYELLTAARRVQIVYQELRRLAAVEERRVAAQLKLHQARLRLIGQDRRLASLPLSQSQIADTIVEAKEVATPISFRNQYTRKSFSLSESVNACTCRATPPATYATSSWSDDEDMDCDFEVPSDWGLSSAQLAEYGLIAASTCFCSEEEDDLSFAHLPSLRRSLSDAVVLRIAQNGQHLPRSQGRHQHFCFLWDEAVKRAIALELPL